MLIAPPAIALVIFAPRSVCAQTGDCAPPPAGDAIVGMVQAATPLLRDGRCARPAARAEVTTELSDTDRARSMDERRTPQAMGARRPSLLGSVLGGDDEQGLALADTLATVTTAGLFTWQMVSDVTLHDRAGLRDDFVLQMLLADALAHGLAQGLTLAVGGIAGGGECAPGDQACEADGLRPSGRTAMAFTSAGLMCLHRQMAGDVDLGECAGAVALASAVGALNVLTDQHDAMDVLVGAAIGLVSGYLAPYATLYAFGNRGPIRRADHEQEDHAHDPEVAHAEDLPEPGDWGLRATIAPSFSSQRGIGLRVQGTF